MLYSAYKYKPYKLTHAFWKHEIEQDPNPDNSFTDK